MFRAEHTAQCLGLSSLAREQAMPFLDELPFDPLAPVGLVPIIDPPSAMPPEAVAPSLDDDWRDVAAQPLSDQEG